MSMLFEEGLLERVRGVILRREAGELSDGQLLGWYLAGRDDNAFRAIVQRHGNMVFGVCRRVLGDVHDAEDAFQASFLVLVRKAASIVPRDKLGGWLHGVACRTAMKAKGLRARRQANERHAQERRAPTAFHADSEQAVWDDLRPLLDRELAALPECYRLPIVLCDLEGKSRKDAARHLGCGEGTLSGRLARGRRRLAERLTRQRIALSAGGLVAFLSQQALAGGPPAPLATATVKAAALVTVGELGAIAAPVAYLVREVLHTMLIQKIRSSALVLLVVVLGFGLMLVSFSAAADDPPVLAAQAGKEKSNKPDKGDGVEAAGAIYLHRGSDFTAFDVRDKKYNDYAPLAEEYLKSYQWRSARLSPDGRCLAFAQTNDRRGFPPSKIQVRELGKDAAPEVVVSMDEKELSNWNWSPDSKKLSFAVWNEEIKEYEPWIVEVATKKTEQVKMPVLKGKADKDWGTQIHAWTPDDLWVVFAKGSFFLMDPKTKETRRLNEEPTSFLYGGVRVSPDGKKLLMVTTTMEYDWTVRVIDLLMAKTTEVASLKKKADVSVAWSPDSRQIALGHADANDEGRPTGNFRVEIHAMHGKQSPRLLVEQMEWLTVTDWR